MRKYSLRISGVLSIAFCLTITSFKVAEEKEELPKAVNTVENNYANHIVSLYNATQLAEVGLSLPVFEKAVTGFYNLKKSGKLADKSILTIADFDQASTKKRLYIIDLAQKKILLNTWVAHGQNTGANESVKFSNKNDSFASSLGFYVTGEIYRGVHGRSLRLDGMDSGFNDNARMRSIVVHGAAYVSAGTINALGRLGRSQGCPAVAPELSEKVITTIGGKTVMFINKSLSEYSSKYLDENVAANFAINSEAV